MDKRQNEIERLMLDYEKQCVKDLRKTYTEALADVKTKLRELLGRDQTQSVAYQIEFQRTLESQLQSAIDTLKSGNITSVTDFLNKTYEDGYLGTIYSIQGQGIPINIGVDHKQAARVINRKTDTFKFSDRLYKNVDELAVAFKSEMTRGIANNSGYTKIAKQLSLVSEASYRRALTIVRTEGGRVKSEAKLDSMKAAKGEGADIVKQWDATFDGKTRPEHRFLDGQIREIDEPFTDSQGRQAQAPHKFGVASMDINCRCIVVERARWAVEGEEMPNKVHNHTGDLVEADDYKEWKNKAQAQLNEKKEATFNKRKEELEKQGVKVFDKNTKKVPKKGDYFQTANKELVEITDVHDFNGIKIASLQNGETVVLKNAKDQIKPVIEVEDIKPDAKGKPLKTIADYDYKEYAKQLDKQGYLTDELYNTHRKFGYEGNDFAVKKLFDDNGYSDLPTVLSPAEFDALSDDEYIRVYRGVADGKGISAKEINKQFAENKDVWVGRGVFGNGTYTNGAKWVANEYAQDVEENILSMAIPKNAKIINYRDLGAFYSKNSINQDIYKFIRESAEFQEGMFGINKKGSMLANYLNDATFQAVNLGYDIIEVDGEDWLKVLSNPEDWEKIIKDNNLELKPHYVVLNRGKIIVKGD